MSGSLQDSFPDGPLSDLGGFFRINEKGKRKCPFRSRVHVDIKQGIFKHLNSKCSEGESTGIKKDLVNYPCFIDLFITLPPLNAIWCQYPPSVEQVQTVFSCAVFRKKKVGGGGYTCVYQLFYHFQFIISFQLHFKVLAILLCFCLFFMSIFSSKFLVQLIWVILVLQLLFQLVANTTFFICILLFQLMFIILQ